MFERYTEKSRRVIFFARYEAAEFGSPYIETEHLLLGLLKEDGPLASRFLERAGTAQTIRQQIEARTGRREKIQVSVDLPLSHECKRILVCAAKEADRLGHKHIGTEHLLLAILLGEEKSFAAEILRQRGAQLSTIRAALMSQPDPERIAAVRIVNPIHWDQFTEAASRAAFLAIQEAYDLSSPAVEIEHLLLGVLREDRLEATLPVRSVATLLYIRHGIMKGIMGISSDDSLRLSCDYRQALAWASDDADRHGVQRIETGHLLLGILEEEDSLAAGILRDHGIEAAAVRAELQGS